MAAKLMTSRLSRVYDVYRLYHTVLVRSVAHKLVQSVAHMYTQIVISIRRGKVCYGEGHLGFTRLNLEIAPCQVLIASEKHRS